MGDFFKPWRRNCGVMLLLMACPFAAGWVRTIGRANQSISFTQNRFPIHEDQVIHYSSMTQDGIEWATERPGSWKDYRLWMIPHHSIAIVLTLHSAYLLLSKSKRNADPNRS